MTGSLGRDRHDLARSGPSLESLRERCSSPAAGPLHGHVTAPCYADLVGTDDLVETTEIVSGDSTFYLLGTIHRS